MTILTMRHDLRAPAFGPATSREIYAAAIEQVRWADRHGFQFAVLSEHHGLDDGWVPAPLTMAAYLLGGTETISVMISATIAPLHDPIRMAEQIAVIDNAAPNRLWTVLAAGYKADEFEMAGVERAERGALVEEHATAMLAAWTGEPFEWRGRTVRVTPRPVTEPHPMLFIGGGKEVAARRAARLGLPMLPMDNTPQLQEWYDDEAAKHGKTGGFVMIPSGPTFVHVTEDPERTWAEIGEYVLYEAQTYASFQTDGQKSLPTIYATSVDDLKSSPQIVVGTPAEVIERAQALGPMGSLTFNPLCGGLPPDLAWASLELFAAEVLPHLG